MGVQLAIYKSFDNQLLCGKRCFRDVQILFIHTFVPKNKIATFKMLNLNLMVECFLVKSSKNFSNHCIYLSLPFIFKPLYLPFLTFYLFTLSSNINLTWACFFYVCELVFKFSHKNVCIRWCADSAHFSTFYL